MGQPQVKRISVQNPRPMCELQCDQISLNLSSSVQRTAGNRNQTAGLKLEVLPNRQLCRDGTANDREEMPTWSHARRDSNSRSPDGQCCKMAPLCRRLDILSSFTRGHSTR